MMMIDVHPATVGDRLRKAAFDATEENRHDDAFLMTIAADLIKAFIEAQPPAHPQQTVPFEEQARAMRQRLPQGTRD